MKLHIYISAAPYLGDLYSVGVHIDSPDGYIVREALMSPDRIEQLLQHPDIAFIYDNRKEDQNELPGHELPSRRPGNRPLPGV